MSAKILKAGAIILSAKNKANIALIYRNKQKDWSFPKGHIEQGENVTQTVKREVMEETGLDVAVLKELPDHFYITEKEGEITTKMFLVVSLDDSKLKNEYEKDEVRWISIDEVVKKLSYDNLKDYFNSILLTIKENIN